MSQREAGSMILRMNASADFLSTLYRVEHLRTVWHHNAANRDRAGIDRVSVDTYRTNLEAKLNQLSSDIQRAAYTPLSVLRVRPFRLQPESLKAYLARYEAELESKTSGEGTPTLRQVIRQQINCLKEMVMKGNVGSFYVWKG